MTPPRVKFLIALLFAFGVLPHAVGERIRRRPTETVGAWDLIKLDIPEYSGLSRSYRIDENGFLRLPGLDKPLAAAGHTTAELVQIISRGLVTQHLFRQVTVTVSLAEMCGVDVSGLVVRPGVVRVPVDGMRLSGVLRGVGGIRSDGDRTALLLFPGGVTRSVDTGKLSAQPELDLVIPPQSEIFVSRAEESSTALGTVVKKLGTTKEPKEVTAQSLQEASFPNASEGASFMEKLALVISVLSAAWSFRVWWLKVQEGKLDDYARRQNVYTRTVALLTMLAANRGESSKTVDRKLRYAEKMFQRAFDDAPLLFGWETNIPGLMGRMREDFTLLLGCHRGSKNAFARERYQQQEAEAFKRIEDALPSLKERVDQIPQVPQVNETTKSNMKSYLDHRIAGMV